MRSTSLSRIGCIFSAFLLLYSSPTATASTTPAPAHRVLAVESDRPAMRTVTIIRDGSALQLGYCGNRAMDRRNTDITHVVVVIHGNGRNACSYAYSVMKAAEAAGTSKRTLVVAPHFAGPEDPEATEPNRLYWGTSGWKSGALSRTAPHPRRWGISSYEVADILVDRLLDRRRLPHVSTVTFAGHSAGGQFVNRYAATTVRPARLTPEVSRRWVVASPSSYIYLTPDRVTPTGGFRPLSATERAECPTYNEFKYGLEDRSGYVTRVSSGEVMQRMATTDVTYLVGDLDTDATDPDLDTSCEAQWQGPQRLARARTYEEHLKAALGSSAASRHKLVVVPGVGHTARRILTSGEGVAALFPENSVR